MNRRRHLNQRAFSLVEVSIAVGLLAFAMVVVLSLLPVGLSTYRDAYQSTTETDALRALGAELAATPYTDLDAFVLSRFPLYIDERGQEVPESGSVVFTVDCRLSAPEWGGQLRRARLLIGRNLDVTTLSDSNPAMKDITQRTFLLINRGL